LTRKYIASARPMYSPHGLTSSLAEILQISSGYRL
jgi:hypothetical protein